jgi:hypothetical protein
MEACWPGSPAGPDSLMGRPSWVDRFSFFPFSFFLFSLFAKPFGHPKIIRKIQIKYLWIPCENGFKMEPLLKQNKKLLKSKFGIHA